MAIPRLAVQLGLDPHPEGGWYRQTWASDHFVVLPDGRERPTATLIYFLLPAGAVSAWHRVRSDELWLAHTGELRLQFGGSGRYPIEGEVELLSVHANAQVLVPADVWQRTLPSDDDVLASCMVSPGFDFEDFELDPGPPTLI